MWVNSTWQAEISDEETVDYREEIANERKVS